MSSDSSTYQFFAAQLLAWYHIHHRDLPWRHTRDPHLIWLSEVILQQTRVAQGLPYFERFAAAYPTIQALAAAPEDEVLKLWQGLGYYSRARNLLKTAQQVVTDFNGLFPESYEKLLQLKGIGPYTAAAIASFAYEERVAVLDGNVYRVLARFFGIENDIAAPASRKVFAEVAQKALPEKESSTYNQAIMEFGALHCTPVAPKCGTCPLQAGCFAFQHNLQRELPVKQKTKRMRERYFNYLVLEWENERYWRKRKPGDIWEGLYEFDLFEAEKLLGAGPLFTDPELMGLLPTGAEVLEES